MSFRLTLIVCLLLFGTNLFLWTDCAPIGDTGQADLDDLIHRYEPKFLHMILKRSGTNFVDGRNKRHNTGRDKNILRRYQRNPTCPPYPMWYCHGYLGNNKKW